jgi:hypothetical protein
MADPGAKQQAVDANRQGDDLGKGGHFGLCTLFRALRRSSSNRA